MPRRNASSIAVGSARSAEFNCSRYRGAHVKYISPRRDTVERPGGVRLRPPLAGSTRAGASAGAACESERAAVGGESRNHRTASQQRSGLPFRDELAYDYENTASMSTSPSRVLAARTPAGRLSAVVDAVGRPTHVNQADASGREVRLFPPFTQPGTERVSWLTC